MELYLKQAGEAAFKPVEVAPDPIAQPRDAGAAILAGHLGWKVISMQEALGLFGAAILMVISIMLIRHGFQIWPGGRRRPIPVIPANDDRFIKIGQKQRSDELDETVDADIIRWIDIGTKPDPHNAPVSTFCYQHFIAFQREFGGELITHNRWSRAMARLNRQGRIDWPRLADTQSRSCYEGRRLDWTLPWAREYYPRHLSPRRATGKPKGGKRGPKPRLVATSEVALEPPAEAASSAA